MKDRFLAMAEDRLAQMEAIINAYGRRNEELKAYRDLRLKPSVRSGRKYYYSKKKGSVKWTYLGDDNNKEVNLIKEEHYCREVLDSAINDSQLLRKLIKEYKLPDDESVEARLPDVYKDAEKNIEPVYSADKRVEEWLKRKRDFKRRYFRDSHPENLKHRAADGTYVRSKSELNIANMLIAHGIPYIYECPRFYDGDEFDFDFTVLSTVDYETEIIIEHQGMMDDIGYQHKYMHTLLTCLDNDIVPNVDIYFTFDDLKGNFDTTQISEIIRTRLK